MEKPVYKVGFTGTSKGASKEQLEEVKKLLQKIKDEHPDHVVELHHGQCIGADTQCAEIAKSLGFRIVAHPGYGANPKNMMYRSDFTGNDEVMEAMPHVKRDQEIVNVTERMIATPLTRAEAVRSGTWTTVRYARKVGRTIDLILPPLPTVPPSVVQPPPRTNAVAGEDTTVPPHLKRGLR